MSLTVLEINYSTNFYEYPMTYQYIPTTGSNSSGVSTIYSKYESQLPKDTLLFTDIVKLDKSDYPSNLADLLNLLSSPNAFLVFLQDKLKKEKRRTGKSYSVTNDERITRKITEFNIDTLLKIFFKLGNKIYLPGADKNRPYTVDDYTWVRNSYSESNINASSTHPDITKISVMVNLKLNQQPQKAVNMEELKKMDCNARRNRIDRIYSVLRNKPISGYKKESIKKTTPAMWRTGGHIGGRRKKRTKRRRATYSKKKRNTNTRKRRYKRRRNRNK